MSRIRVTHVGSLVRPPELVELLEIERDGGNVDPAALDDCLARSVREVVRQQVDVGVDIVSDGEFGKSYSWSQYVLKRLTGVELRPAASHGTIRAIGGKDRADFAEFYAEYEGAHGVVGLGKNALPPGMWAIVGPLGYDATAITHDIARFTPALADAGGDVRGFLPVVSPTSVIPARIDEHYADEVEALFAIADALNVEYRAVVDAGLTVQVDDAYLATTFDVMVPPASLADYRAWAEVRVEAVNRALAGIPEERSRYHVCWGSWNGPHTNDVPLRDIVDLVLRVRVGGYALEMANPRHEHEWQVWQTAKLPDERVLLPGLVSHSTNVVEHPELVAERLLRIARLVGPERVIASTDCGFAQGPFTRRVHPTIMWAKLRSLAQGAELAGRAL